MADFDIVIRNGTVVDGSGGEPYVADIAITGPRIAEIGRLSGRGREEVDAAGRIVTPGFVDVHTHYDGQASWTSQLSPSSMHGVTTAIMGNCGVGFAPCRPKDRARLIQLMEGIEDIPNPVLSAGLPWNWETFPDYINALSSKPYDIDIGGYLPHSALRVYVMGQRGLDCEPATEADIVEMRKILREAMGVGAFGLATSRTIFHRSSDGKPIPTRDASRNELIGLAEELKLAGKGVIQCAVDSEDVDLFFDQITPMAVDVGVPLFFSLTQRNNVPNQWREILDRAAGLNRDKGANIKAQVLSRGVGFILGHHLTLNPFSLIDAYRDLRHLPLEELIAQLQRPEVKDRILAEQPHFNPKLPLAVLVRDFSRMFRLGDPPNYEPSPENSIAAEAARIGVRPESLAYDLLLENGGRNALYLIVNNYADMSLSGPGDMMRHQVSILGLGDAGAHCGTICDGAYPSFMLTHWARDRTRGERLPLPWVVKALSHDTAAAIGLADRGRLAAGYRADVNVIDFERLHLHAPFIASDLPSGGKRLLQRADGYDATLVGGVVTYRHGEATGALPGRVLRGPGLAT